ncbi:MAG: hypothetical protein OD817_03295 [Gammaproteobacteria bacterium]
MTEKKPKFTAEFWQRRWKKTPRRVAIWAIFAFIITHFLPHYDESTGEFTALARHLYFWPGGILNAAELLGSIMGRILFPALIAFPCFFIFWPPDSWLPEPENSPKGLDGMEILRTILIGLTLHVIIIGGIFAAFVLFAPAN